MASITSSDFLELSYLSGGFDNTPIFVDTSLNSGGFYYTLASYYTPTSGLVYEVDFPVADIIPLYQELVQIRYLLLWILILIFFFGMYSVFKKYIFKNV